MLQKLLLGRGTWDRNDYRLSGLAGIQFANGPLTQGFLRGYDRWIEALRSGSRLMIIGGNDAHGNFNRFRQIGIPFILLKESEDQLFGKIRTGIFLPLLSRENILNALRSGTSIVTDGPVINLRVDASSHESSAIGNMYRGSRHTVFVEARSSQEFGSIASYRVFRGIIGKAESPLDSLEHPGSFNFDRSFEIDVDAPCYLRAEVWTGAADAGDGKRHFCLTNPVWFDPSK